MRQLMVSLVRFTTAATLYGIEQVQSASNATRGGQDLFRVLDRFEAVLDSLTGALVDRIDEGKRLTLKSVTRAAEGVMNSSFEGMKMMDPHRLLRMMGDFWRKSSDTMADWYGKPVAANGSEPKAAADVLA